MSRPRLTQGNIDYAGLYQRAFQAHSPDKPLPTPPRAVLRNEDGDREDKSEFAEPNQWSELIAEDLAASFGRAGAGAITTIAEAFVVIHALAHPHRAEKIYYRGEHQYGYELKSRAQRNIERERGAPIELENGITDREIAELRRFQNKFRNNQALVDELIRRMDLPRDDDPDWLPIMQHYDVQFGTRLIDITRSLFVGLHFACIDWDGMINFETDGLLYIFLGHGRYLKYGRTDEFEDEISEFVPYSVTNAFRDWRMPDYMHHFSSSQSSMRELAQDGLFLVQGKLGTPPVFGGNGQFKVCIPGWAKARIIEELWFAGYTPERIVRGELGRQAAETSRARLGDYRETNPGWNHL